MKNQIIKYSIIVVIVVGLAAFFIMPSVVSQIKGNDSSVADTSKDGTSHNMRAENSEDEKHNENTKEDTTVTTTEAPITTTKAPVTTTKAPATTRATTKAPAVAVSDYEREVLRLCNIERKNAGLSDLVWSDKAGQATDVRAKELVTLFDHKRPDGSSCFTALDQAGVNYRTCGENIAAGQQTPAEVVADWMNSEGHRENILNGDYKYLGVGYYYSNAGYRHQWVQLFWG